MTIVVDGTSGLTFNDSSLQGAAASPYVLKNRIINGDMRIDQRNAGSSTTPSSSNTYNLDRWVTEFSQVSKLTVQQNYGSVTPPTGFTNYLGIKVAATATVGAGDYFVLEQRIEGFNTADLAWGTASAKTVTLSFWVYSNITGTFGGNIQNGSGGNRNYPFSYTISVANTWEQKTITIPGDTSGTWATGNTLGIDVYFSLGTGTTYSGAANTWATGPFLSTTGATSIMGSTSNYWYVTGVQLEIGTSATPFERRLYNQELANCYRYCWNLSSVGGNDNYSRFGVGGAEGTTSTEITISFPVTMRANPSLTTTGTASNYAIYSAGTITAVSSIVMTGAISTQTGLVNASVASGLTAGRETTLMSNNNKIAYLLFTAEL
jgi:hypothetical protein